MAKADQIADLIALPGTSQPERTLAALDPATAPADGRSAADRLSAFASIAQQIRYAGAGGPDWRPLFAAVRDPVMAAALLARTDGQVAPHLGLAAAFAELMGEPIAALDSFTARHLDHYLLEVLGLVPRAPTPDKAIARIELKPRVAPAVLDSAHVFSAGKDPTGVERLYVPTGQTVIRQAAVTNLCSVFRDAEGEIHAAPVANSADGLGKPLDPSAPSWLAFGSASLPVAQLGFGLGSTALRLAQGTRKITVELTLENLPELPDSFWDGAFSVLLTGPKGWIGPTTRTPLRSDQKLTFDLELTPEDPAVVDYDGAVHGLATGPAAPLMQVLLNSRALRSVGDWAGVLLRRARISVDVKGLMPSALENDAGTLNPKKPFVPFGAVPVRGSLLRIGCDEALSKRVSALTLQVQWKGVPAEDLSAWYAGYPTTFSGNSWFKGLLRFVDVSGVSVERFTPLFNATDATELIEWSTTVQPASPKSSTRWKPPFAAFLQTSRTGAKTGSATQKSASTFSPEDNPGFVTVELKTSLLHEEYRKKLTEQILVAATSGDSSPTLINEPYTPTIASLKINYSAQTEDVNFAGVKQDSLEEDEIAFYHLDCFGQHREHRALRAQIPWSSGEDVPLFPPFPDEGELLIGLSPLSAGDSVSLHVQVLDGSADPTLSRATLRWHVLAQNHWRALEDRHIAKDTTNAFLRSGLVQLLVPMEADTTNTRLPSGILWLKVSVASGSGAVCRLLEVANNGVELVFVDQGNDPNHLKAPLPAGSITRLKTPMSSVKSVKQPYSSFGGAATEDTPAFRLRASERMRHRDRAVTPADYERLVLQAFPQVYRAKCLPHSWGDNWFAPGHVTLVLVPNLYNQNAANPLRPMVDADTLNAVVDWLQDGHMSPCATVHAKNASFHRVRLDFKVRFRPGLEFNANRARLEADIMRALSPWAFDGTQDLSFGGRIYRSVLLDYVEELDYVDFVTDFKMLSLPEGATTGTDQHVIIPERPDAILVSDGVHSIAPVEVL